MGDIKSAIIGCGRIAGLSEDTDTPSMPTTHAGAYKSLSSRVTLSAICDKDPGALSKFSKMWNVKNTYSSHKDLLRSEEIQVLSVCVDAEHHYSICMDALSLSSSLRVIWCEKPMTLSLEQSELLVRESEKRGVLIVVNHCRRWDPYYTLVSDLIDSGEIGEPYMILARSAVGLVNCGSHLFDLMIQCADSHVDYVFSDVIKDESVDPGGVGFVKFKNGVHGFVDCTWKEYFDFGISVRGTKGEIEVIETPTHVREIEITKYTTLTESEKRKIEIPNSSTRMKDALLEILSNIEHSTPVRSSGTTGIHSLEVAQAFHESWETGAKVLLPLKNRSRTLHSRKTSFTKNGELT